MDNSALPPPSPAVPLYSIVRDRPMRDIRLTHTYSEDDLVISVLDVVEDIDSKQEFYIEAISYVDFVTELVSVLFDDY